MVTFFYYLISFKYFLIRWCPFKFIREGYFEKDVMDLNYTSLKLNKSKMTKLELDNLREFYRV